MYNFLVDGKNPNLICCTVAGKVLIYNPYSD